MLRDYFHSTSLKICASKSERFGLPRQGFGITNAANKERSRQSESQRFEVGAWCSSEAFRSDVALRTGLRVNVLSKLFGVSFHGLQTISGLTREGQGIQETLG